MTSVSYLLPEPKSLQLLFIGVTEQHELLHLVGQISLLSPCLHHLFLQIADVILSETKACVRWNPLTGSVCGKQSRRVRWGHKQSDWPRTPWPCWLACWLCSSSPPGLWSDRRPSSLGFPFHLNEHNLAAVPVYYPGWRSGRPTQCREVKGKSECVAESSTSSTGESCVVWLYKVWVCFFGRPACPFMVICCLINSFTSFPSWFSRLVMEDLLLETWAIESFSFVLRACKRSLWQKSSSLQSRSWTSNSCSKAQAKTGLHSSIAAQSYIILNTMKMALSYVTLIPKTQHFYLFGL